MNAEEPSKPTISDILKSLAEGSIVLGALIFVVGWSYSYGYYRSFGFSTDELKLSVDSILIHSIPVFETAVGYVAMGLFSICWIALSYWTIPKSLRLSGS